MNLPKIENVISRRAAAMMGFSVGCIVASFIWAYGGAPLASLPREREPCRDEPLREAVFQLELRVMKLEFKLRKEKVQ